MLLFALVESCFINILDVSGPLVRAGAGLFQTNVHHNCICFRCCLLCPQAQARSPLDRLSCLLRSCFALAVIFCVLLHTALLRVPEQFLLFAVRAQAQAQSPPGRLSCFRALGLLVVVFVVSFFSAFLRVSSVVVFRAKLLQALARFSTRRRNCSCCFNYSRSTDCFVHPLFAINPWLPTTG